MITIYTDRFIPKKHQACTRGPVILIRPEFKGDKGLLEHEKVHRKQWLRTVGLHGLLYRFVPEYRLAAEVEAFREQARHCPDDRVPIFAWYIADKYGPRASADAVRGVLT